MKAEAALLPSHEAGPSVRRPHRQPSEEKGARTGGVAGFTLGVGKGLVGAAIRPAAGVLQLTTSMASAASAASGEGAGNDATHSARVGRVRPPRMLHGAQRRIAPFSIGEALAKHVLLSAEEGSARRSHAAKRWQFATRAGWAAPGCPSQRGALCGLRLAALA